MDEQQTEEKSAYGKKPLWQWIVLYIVIGGILYAVIYFVFLHKQNPYSYNISNNQTKSMTQTQQMQNGVYKTMAKDKLGMVMTDTKGMTLYTFAKDSSGISNCTGGCLQAWPAYIAQSQTGNLPANISVIKRPDGTLQYAWKGMPLYYYSKDGDSGDAYGNGIGSVWSVIKQSQGQAQTSPTAGITQATTGQNAVTIQNFAFFPATLTVEVGDKVTWTNQDSVGHSATADDNSFDTGVLAQGQSGSITFSKAGTYTYHCSVHPIMKGTIVVQ